jgi:hypothetical protein
MNQKSQKITNKEIKQIYRTKIKPHVKQLSKERSKLVVKTLLIFPPSLGVTILVINLINHRVYNLYPLEFATLLAFIIVTLFFYVKYGSFKVKYKNKIIKTAFEAFFPESSYSPHSSFNMSNFNDLNLFKSQANIFNSEDEIKGIINKTRFTMCEVLAKRKTGTGNDRRTETIFRGFVYQIDFNKFFNADTSVQTDVAEKMFGS